MGNQSSSSPNNITNKTKDNFDPFLYSGVWYEIGKKEFVWEKDCYGAKAIYTYDELNKTINVENQCINPDGSVKRSRFAKARIPDTKDASKLLIKFVDGLPSYPGESPYWVFDTDYVNYSIVGGPSGQFLWLLGRKPTMSYREVVPLLEKIRKIGYNPDQLVGNPGVITES